LAHDTNWRTLLFTSPESQSPSPTLKLIGQVYKFKGGKGVCCSGEVKNSVRQYVPCAKWPQFNPNPNPTPTALVVGNRDKYVHVLGLGRKDDRAIQLGGSLVLITIPLNVLILTATRSEACLLLQCFLQTTIPVSVSFRRLVRHAFRALVSRAFATGSTLPSSAGVVELRTCSMTQFKVVLHEQMGICVAPIRPFRVALGAESRVCYPDNTADRQPQ
jgi:hypothetical protein